MHNVILVTGGAGFVGSNLVKRLAENPENTIISVDNYFTGSWDSHVDLPNVTYFQKSTAELQEWTFKIRPTLVYHLGEYSRVEQSFDDVDLVHEFNTNGTYNILKLALKWEAKVVYAGSSTKFADQTPGYVMSPYAFSKAQNTELVKKFGEWYGLDYAISYFYNVYGPGEISQGKYATLIAKFAEKKAKGETLTITSPGTQERNFTHVDDIVDGLMLIGEQGHGDEYGIGHPDAYSIIDVAMLFDADFEMGPGARGNRMSAPVITDKIRELGWEPRHDLVEYITKREFATT